MEAVTVAGLALGILPLIVSALENYQHTFQPLIIFTRDCPKEVERFQLGLKVQRTAFENACRLLMSSTTEYQYEVPQMVQDPAHHHLWREENFARQLRCQLGEFFEACIAALLLVKHTLDDTMKKYGQVGMLLSQKTVRL